MLSQSLILNLFIAGKMPKNSHPQLELIKFDPNVTSIHIKNQNSHSSKTGRTTKSSFKITNPEERMEAERQESGGDMKINSVINEMSSTKNEIMLLKARINKLKNQKVSNEKRANRSLETAARINSTRERVLEKQKLQAMILEHRSIETSMRKIRANKFRIQIRKDLEKARRKVEVDKVEKAAKERSIRALDEQYIEESKELEKQEKILKAQTVRKFEEEHSEKMHFFYETSRVRSHYNHVNRFNHFVGEKKKIETILERLQKQEKRMEKEAMDSSRVLAEAEEKLKDVITQSNVRARSTTRSGVRSGSSIG